MNGYPYLRSIDQNLAKRGLATAWPSLLLGIILYTCVTWLGSFAAYTRLSGCTPSSHLRHSVDAGPGRA